jgi:hypothetical protein
LGSHAPHLCPTRGGRTRHWLRTRVLPRDGARAPRTLRPAASCLLPPAARSQTKWGPPFWPWSRPSRYAGGAGLGPGPRESAKVQSRGRGRRQEQRRRRHAIGRGLDRARREEPRKAQRGCGKAHRSQAPTKSRKWRARTLTRWRTHTGRKVPKLSPLQQLIKSISDQTQKVLTHHRARALSRSPGPRAR